MESEKHLIPKTGEDSPSDLPQPNVARPNLRRRLQVTRRAIVFGLIAFFTLYHLGGGASHRSLTNQEAEATRTISPLEGYLGGVATKGFRQALGLQSKQHQHHSDHGRAKHGHKHHHHGRPIPPAEAEEIFLSVPNNNSARAALRRYTSDAHAAGSGFDFVSALNIKNEWERALGLPSSGPEENIHEAGSSESRGRILGGLNKLGVWIDTYYPVLNAPVHASVTVLSDPPFHAKLREDIVEGDPDSVLRDEVKVFHGLSVSGDVTAKYVYVGYGRKADFDLIKEKGIDLNGKIVLARYGRIFRGLKIKAAQEAGAIGVLVFTDPADDGDFTEENGHKPYPDGPARQPSSVQRGSVQFISKYPGDPSTPGEPAYRNATRVKGGNQPSIPSLPISYEDAIPILKALQGKGLKAGDVSSDWVGGLGYYGVEYWTGPSEDDLHLVNEVNTRVTPIWNTLAVIPGHISDEVVIVGNHRDAWVLGAADPSSGTASQYEVIRGLGKLLSHGWKPLRTIILASWDAEEYGLIGSTEWTEDFGKWLKTDAAAYLNLDVSVSGSKYGAAASPSLAWLLRRAAEEVLTASDSSRSVWDTRSDGGDWKSWRATASGVEELDYEELELANSGTGVKALGSGSDFTAFLQRYGVASGNIGYAAGPKDAVYHYHSIYDTFAWEEKYADPGFHRHVDVAKILGLATLRLSDSLVLPINTTQYAIELGFYLEKVKYIANSLNLAEGLDLSSLNKSIGSLISTSHSLDHQKHAAVHKLRRLLPKRPKHPHGNFFNRLAHRWWKVRAACGSEKAQERLERYAYKGWPHVPDFPPIKRIKEVKEVLKEIRGINKKLQGFEGGFISEEGIKEREWYKHKGVAPGLWLGYGATTFPALTEALTIDKSVELAQKEADELTELISHIAKRLEA